MGVAESLPQQLARAMPSRGRSWCVTLNNYTQAEFDKLKQLFPDQRYYVLGKEVSASGTPHIQGYLEFENQHTLRALRRESPRAHFEPRRGLPSQAADYCKKDGDFEESGTRTVDPSVREKTNWEELIKKIQALPTFNDVLNDHSLAKIVATRMQWAQAIHNARKCAADDPTWVPYGWQQNIINLVSGPVDDRKIVWCWDADGNKGKSRLVTHLIKNYGAIKMGNRTADCAHAWNGERVVLWDFSRTQSEKVNYDIIEQVKGGTVFSGKYQSCNKVFASPHVLIFANFPPDQSALSADRWDIRDLA